jgi:hypothetical protein
MSRFLRRHNSNCITADHGLEGHRIVPVREISRKSYYLNKYGANGNIVDFHNGHYHLVGLRKTTRRANGKIRLLNKTFIHFYCKAD